MRDTDHLLFAEEVDEDDDFIIRDDLSYRDKKEAEFLYSISRGVMLVTGKAGSGKDLFGISVCAENKYFFNRRILLDFIPKRPFGEYTLFNGQVMMREINKMAKLAGVEHIDESADKKEQSEFLEEASKHWVENEGEVLLRRGVLYLQELKRYCYNRTPHNPFNKFIGAICTQWRHLDLLIIGTHIFEHEIDQYSYLAYVDHRAKCSWSLTREDTTDIFMTRGAFVGAHYVYDMSRKKVILHVDGRKPRRYLNGHCLYDLYVSKSMVNLKPIVRRNN